MIRSDQEEHYCLACGKTQVYDVLEKVKIYYGYRVKMVCQKDHWVVEHRRH